MMRLHQGSFDCDRGFLGVSAMNIQSLMIDRDVSVLAPCHLQLAASSLASAPPLPNLHGGGNERANRRICAISAD